MTLSELEAEAPQEVAIEAAMPVAEEVSVIPAAEPATAAPSDAGELPGFLTGQQAEKPVRPAISKRKRSFIDRVFGNKKDTAAGAEQGITETEMAEAPIEEPVLPAAPLEVAEIPTAQPQVQEQPAASIDELDAPQDEPAQIVAQAEAPAVTAEAETAPSLELSAPETEAPEIAEEVVEAPKAAETAKAPAAPKAPEVSAPSVDAVAVQPVVQTTMDTGPTMSGGSFEGDQLDIPAFLRR